MASIILEVNKSGGTQKVEFDDPKRLVVGRIQSAEIHANHPDMANVHALIEVNSPEQTIKIVDVSGADKGTFVNGNKIIEYVLTQTDQVQVGPLSFSIYFKSPQKGVSPPPGVKPIPKTPPPPPPPLPKKTKVPRSAVAPTPAPRPAVEMTVGENTVVTIAAPIARTTTTGEVVEIIQMLGPEILEVVTFPAGKEVTVGETLAADFTIPLDEFSDKGPAAFVRKDAGTLTLFCHPERMKGAIRTGGKVYSLKQAVQEGVLKTCGGPFGYHVQLSDQDFAKISIGNITFFVMQVPEPPKPKPAGFIDFDPILNRVMAVVSFFWIAFMLFAGLMPADTDIVAERAIDKVFQRILIRKDVAPPMQIQKRFNLIQPPELIRPKVSKGGGNEGAGVKMAGAEGKRGRTDLPEKKKGVTAQRRQERKVVSPLQQGLLGAITSAGMGTKLNTLVSKGGTLEKSLQGAGGSKLESGGGTGGQGLRGTGLGGGGESAYISGLGTKGRGGGKVGYGEGAVLGKGVSGVLGIGDEVYIEGQLSKEEIRRVVLAHQNELIGCYQLELSRQAGLRGVINFSWIIAGDGTVSTTRVRSATWRDKSGDIDASAINQCMLSKIQTWVFPKPRGGGIVTVSEYPFNFSPGN